MNISKEGPLQGVLVVALEQAVAALFRRAWPMRDAGTRA